MFCPSLNLTDIEKQNNDILQCFKGSVCASLELELNTTYYITAFKVTKNNYYIIYAYTEQEENKIFSLFYAPPLIKKILEGIDKICVRDCGNNTYCNTSTYKDYLIVFTPEKYEYKNNNKYVRIGQYKTFFGSLDNADDIVEDLQTLKKEENNHILQVLEGEYKTTTVNRLEELQDNTDYTITHIKTILYRGIDRYIFRIKEDNKIYISNYLNLMYDLCKLQIKLV